MKLSETTFPVYNIDQQACSEIFTEMNFNCVPNISLLKEKGWEELDVAPR